MSKVYKIGYYVLTVLLSALMLISIYGGFFPTKEGTDLMARLGYPMYVLTMLSYFKILGIIGVWQTKWPRVREWAYAGFFFDMVGATWSMAAVGEPVGGIVATALMTIVLVLGSYFCMHKVKG